MRRWASCCWTLGILLLIASSKVVAEQPKMLRWQELPSLPDELGVAGPFAGIHNDALIVAGGANFPKPVWDNDKVWHDHIFVLTKAGDGAMTNFWSFDLSKQASPQEFVWQ